jgi:hypothetical protein
MRKTWLVIETPQMFFKAHFYREAIDVLVSKQLKNLIAE